MPSDTELATVFSDFASDPEFADLLEAFVGNLPATVGEIERAMAEGRTEDLRRRVHQLKGAGGGYGFGTITELAQAAQAGLHGGSADVPVIVRRLIEYCRRVSGYDRSREQAAVEPGAGYRKSA